MRRARRGELFPRVFPRDIMSSNLTVFFTSNEFPLKKGLEIVLGTVAVAAAKLIGTKIPPKKEVGSTPRFSQ